MKTMINAIAAFALSSSMLAGNPTGAICHCEGSGDHTLVFEAGIGNWSLFFQPLVRELNLDARICLIDRSGYSRRNKSQASADARTIAGEMKLALDKAGVKGPVILAGHSMGGLNVRMFQNLYPEMVEGMILLDAAHPLMWDREPALKTGLERQIEQMAKIRKLATLGLLRVAKKQIPTFGLPPEYHKAYYKVVVRAFYHETYIREMRSLGESLDQCRQLGTLGDLPLLVIGSTQGLNMPADQGVQPIPEKDTAWLDLQRDLATLSVNAIFVESKGDHFVQLSDTQPVADAIGAFFQKYFSSKSISK